MDCVLFEEWRALVEVGFWKMHGVGNDFVVIDNMEWQIPEDELGKAAVKLCHRHFSVGADGILYIYGSNVADARMRIFNADGSEAEMCGNGVRCFAKYCIENGIIEKKKELKVETLAGVKTLWLETKSGKVTSAKVDMGEYSLERRRIPIAGRGEFVNQDLNVDGKVYKVTCVSVGNPHCVTFVDDTDSFPVGTVGPKIENHEKFPAGINAEFAKVLNRKEIKLRVWERGVGETLACGTGTCATVVAANILGKVGNVCTVHLLGGDLLIELRGKRIFMTGAAEKAFEGTAEL